MSDLREAIARAHFDRSMLERDVEFATWDSLSDDQRDGWLRTTDKVFMPVFEAYLREHEAQAWDDATRHHLENDRWLIQQGEREATERIRQRIEALPGVITGMEYVHGVREGNSAIVMRADVLEALGGSDE